MTEEISPFSNADVRKFKAAAQRLKPILKVGKNGLSPQFIQSVEAVFETHELIKIKFDEFKDQRKTLAPELAAKTKSHLITLLGNVVVLYRRRVEKAES
jgi:RNA-binding protein